MKRVLIISPYFVPFNTPDMQRVRMSLPHFKENGWQPEVITVHENHITAVKDEGLWATIPNDVPIHRVRTLPLQWTKKIGLGSLALRSLWYFLLKGNELIRKGNFDLVYFSTTQFPLCVLGLCWNKKFNIPYVIDMQDPWHTDYYMNKPRAERPKKYWFSYRLNKYLEPLAMKAAGGLISVSQLYLDHLNHRYPRLKALPQALITFGYSDLDLAISARHNAQTPADSRMRLSYIGVLGPMMHKSLALFFAAAAQIEHFQRDFDVVFQGTSYAGDLHAKKTAAPVAKGYGLENIKESTTRLSMPAVLSGLRQANGLLIFGTDYKGYTASKLYPYLQSGKPLLVILHPASNACNILQELSSAVIILLDDEKETVLIKLKAFLAQVRNREQPWLDRDRFSEFSAARLTARQTELFEKVIKS